MTETLTWLSIDKFGWGDGPWQHEPDKIQWQDHATGLVCLAKRNPRAGCWNGYVGLPPEHPLYETHYRELEDVEVHGGLTYSDHSQEGPDEFTIGHVPDPGEPSELWWFGFDCHHHLDYAPAIMGGRTDVFYRYTYRTLGYVQDECERLATQLKSRSPR